MSLENQQFQIQNAGAAWSHQTQGDVTRFEVRAGDHWSGDGAGGTGRERSEIASYQKLNFGVEYEINFSIMIEPGAKNTAQWMSLVQIQSTFDQGEIGHSPPFVLEMSGDRMRIATRETNVALSDPEAYRYTAHYTDSADIIRGKWYDFKIHIKFDPAGNGSLDVWRDGFQIVNFDGAIGFNDVVGPYFKEGVYREEADETFAANYKGLTFSEVTAPVAPPPADPAPATPTPSNPTPSTPPADPAPSPSIPSAPLPPSTPSAPATQLVPPATPGAVGETFINTEVIKGNFSLGLMNDVYDGRLGQATGMVSGGGGSDTLMGGDHFDYLHGNAGSDSISGGGGDDWVVGGQGEDMLDGGTGDDLIYGNLGADTLSGGDGADFIRGGQGDDNISGGAGDDHIWGDRGADTLSGGAGADTFSMFAGSGSDRVIDFSFADGDRIHVEGGATFTVAMVGGDTVVSLGNGDQMVLVGVDFTGISGWTVTA